MDKAAVINNHENKEYVLVVTEQDTEMCELIKSLHTLTANRTIIPAKVKAIKLAFANGDYIPPVEIQVPDWEVMEGNHRLTAVQECIEEGIPFTFRMHLYKAEQKVIDITRIVNNTQKRWTSMDRLMSYVREEGNVGIYTDFLSFLRTNADIFSKGENSTNFNVTIGLAALGNGRSTDSMLNAFYSGKLIVKEHDFNNANALLNELRLLTSILEEAGIEDVNLYNRYSIGVWTELRKKNNWPVFLKKFKKGAHKWVMPASSMKEWKRMYYDYFVPKG